MQKADGYRGIWYFNQPSDDEYKYKYSGGLGTYCAKHLPLAYYAREADRTFFCYGGTVPGQQRHLSMVSYYDHASGAVPRPTILVEKDTDDAHDNPTLMLDDDGCVWVFASAHGTSRPAYIFRSTKPYDTDSFEQLSDWNYSYPQPWWLEGRGFFFLHTRYSGRNRRLFWMNSANGRDWTEPKLLSHMAQGHYQVSWIHGNKVGTAFNYHPEPGGLNYRTNLYYVECADFGKTWRNAQGATIDTPLRDAQNDALVRDYESEGLVVYMKDLNFDSQGNPIILYVTSRGYASGPQNGPRTWTTAHWTGAQWRIREAIESDNNYDTGCLHVEDDGTWRIIGPTETGPQPYNPGGEMALWLSHDEGETWTKQRQITKGSRFNHTYARRPVHAHPEFYAFWADGNAREPSDSRLYFCDRSGENVRRLPFEMKRKFAPPELVE